MKSFSTKDGDVVVEKTIAMVSDQELLRQKVERVLGTNKGEWEFDEDEGIEFAAVLRKNPNKDEIKATIEEALARIDSTFVVTVFELTVEGRKAVITFEAVNGDGATVGGNYSYG